MQTQKKYASVLLDAALDKTLDYEIPPHFLENACIGTRVTVPLRGGSSPGYIMEIKDHSPFPNAKPITHLLSEGQPLPADLFQLAQWIATYYGTPLRQVLRIMVPAGIRSDKKQKQQYFVMRTKTREELQELCISIRNKYPAQAQVLDVMLQVTKGILLTELLEKTGGTRSPVDSLVKKGCLEIDIVRIDRSPLVNEEYFPSKAKRLNGEQAIALEKIQASLKNCKYETHLLHGITGSGKTEIYLQAIEQAQQLQKGTIMLVPEISLTIQTIERFRSRFEGHIAILHHRLSEGERLDEWNKIRRSEASIVIGARSAIFSPVQNLGLIIIDEEHEGSYKQSDEMPCYNARDVAVMRAKMANVSVILGSATPSLESYYNAQQGKYTLSVLKGRADTAVLPKVTIVDMKQEFERAKNFVNFSELLLDKIKKRIAIGEQTILFLNRRGYHTALMCQQCSCGIRCQHCEIALTYHQAENRLSCHLCGYHLSPPPKSCPGCKALDTMKFKGVGTEQIEKALHAVFPEVRTLRIDADTTRHKGSHRKLLQAFGTGKADVLIGTQMIAKGLHFSEVTLVGVLNSDASLNIPDFRASETVFQLITQVAGRAGRGLTAGEVIIQSSMPENSTICLAAQQDYENFFKEEIAVREMFAYPPFKQLVKIAFSGEDAKQTEATSELLRKLVGALLPNAFELYPTVPSGYAKVKNRYRFQFLIKGTNTAAIVRSINQVKSNKGNFNLPQGVRMRVDVNPFSTFF